MTQSKKIYGLIIISAILIMAILIMMLINGNFMPQKGLLSAKPQKIEYHYSNEVPPERIIRKTPPLPDLSGYTVAAVKKKLKPISPGYTLIQKLEDGYRRMRLSIDYFAALQDRTEPVVITIADGVYDLHTLTQEIDNSELLEQKNGYFYLHVPLTIRGGGMLIVEDQKLRLSASTGTMINNFGKFLTVNSTLEGWNVTDDKPAKFSKTKEFRPHIINWCGSEMDVAGSTISHLGYQESKAYGITYTSCLDTFYRHDYGHLPGGTGWLINNKFIDIYFGFYSYEADHIAIVGNEYIDNIVYGIDPHDRSSHLMIAHNKVSGTKKRHGIIGSRGVRDSYIIYNQTENNKGSGIMLDRNSNDNIVAHNISQNNGTDGITFYESANNLSFNNSYLNNAKSGFRVRNSWGITSYHDVMNNNKSAAIELYTAYLKIEDSRDLGLDPYAQKAGVSVIEPEIIGNKTVNFKLKDIDQFVLYHPKFYKYPTKQFSSADKALSMTLETMLNGSNTEIYVKQKNAN